MTRDRRPEVVTSLERRWGGLGTGAVRATGFYEGSLMVEGIPDRHEPQPVTGRWSRRSRRLPHDGASDGAKAPKRRVAKAAPDSAEEGEATGVSEARSKKSPSTVGRQRPRSHAVDMSRPRSTRLDRENLSATGWCSERSAEADEDGVNHPFPQYYRMEPKTPWGAHAVKIARADWERARYGCT